jgi:hypothetical protein
MTYGPPVALSLRPAQPQPDETRSAGQVLDLVATWSLLALQGVVLVGSVYVSLFFAMATDSCYDDRCNTDKLLWAYVVADGGGIAVVAVATIAAIILTVRRRTAFWVPLVGLILQVFTFSLGMGLAGSVAPS